MAGVGFTLNQLPETGLSEKHRRKLIDLRARLVHQTKVKNGIVLWTKNGFAVPMQAFSEAFCTPHNLRSQKAAQVHKNRSPVLIRLSEAQNHRCCYCGIETTYAKCYDNTATIEHLTPQGHGGTDDWKNLVMACLRCNNQRKQIDYMLFFDGRLWEQPLVRELIGKMKAFKRSPNIRILQAMECRCEGTARGTAGDKILIHTKIGPMPLFPVSPAKIK